MFLKDPKDCNAFFFLPFFHWLSCQVLSWWHGRAAVVNDCATTMLTPDAWSVVVAMSSLLRANAEIVRRQMGVGGMRRGDATTSQTRGTERGVMRGDGKMIGGGAGRWEVPV